MIRDHVEATDGPFALRSQEFEAVARKVFIDDAIGIRHGYERDGVVLAAVLVSPSAARLAELATEHAAAQTRKTASDNNAARVELLARRAARFAKDPVVNAADQLTVRLQHELLARLALAVGADNP